LEDATDAKGTSVSLFANVLDKSGADITAVKRGVQKLVVRLPSQDPPPEDVSYSGGAMRILRDAQKASKEAGDTFIGTIHLCLPLWGDAQLANIFKEAGATEQAAKSAISTLRAGKKFDSRGADETLESLKKFAVNLTQLAAEGKLDPVISRDDEIRRVIRILSRR